MDEKRLTEARTAAAYPTTPPRTPCLPGSTSRAGRGDVAADHAAAAVGARGGALAGARGGRGRGGGWPAGPDGGGVVRPAGRRDGAAGPGARDADRAAAAEAPRRHPPPRPRRRSSGGASLRSGRECASARTGRTRHCVRSSSRSCRRSRRPEAATTLECRPGGERGVALEVRDGERSGVLTVTYLPPGPASSDPTSGARTAPTASGGTVVVTIALRRARRPSAVRGPAGGGRGVPRPPAVTRWAT